MKTICCIVTLFALITLSTNTLAGKSGSFGSRSGGYKSYSSSSRTTTTYRPSAPYSKPNISSYATAKNKPAQRQSLLSGGSTPPPRVAQIIKEKESRFGTGFMSGAILMYMLSSNDLSSKDKGWVQGKLNELKANGEPIDDGLIRNAPPALNFSYIGLKPQYKSGENLNIIATATEGNKALPIKCAINDAEISSSGNSAHIAWVSMAPAAVILTCESNGHKDKRIIHIV